MGRRLVSQVTYSLLLTSLLALLLLLFDGTTAQRASYWWEIHPLNLNALTDNWGHEKVAAAYNRKDQTAVVVFTSKGSGTGIRSTLVARRLWFTPDHWHELLEDDAKDVEEKVIYTATTNSVRVFDASIACDNDKVWVIMFSALQDADEDIWFSRSSNNGASWSVPVRLDATAMGADTSVDTAPRVLWDGRDNTFYVAWLSGQSTGGTGEDLDVSLSVSKDQGSTWSSPVWVNSEQATTDSRDESNVRIVPGGPGAGCIHVLYRSDDPHGGVNAGTDGDIFITSSCDGGTTFTNTRVIHDQMTNATDTDVETTFDACASANGNNIVVVYRSEKSDSIARLVKAVESHDGGQNFSIPETLQVVWDATETNTAPSCRSDSRGLFITAFGSRRRTSQSTDSDYGEEDPYNPDTILDTQTDIDIFFSIASSRPNGIPGSGWSNPMVTDQKNAKSTADHDEPVLIEDGEESWVIFSRTNQRMIVYDEHQYDTGTDFDIVYEPFIRIWDKMYYHNGPGLVSYSPRALQEKIDWLPMNVEEEIEVPFSGSLWFGREDAEEPYHRGDSMVHIGGGRKIRLVKAVKYSWAEFGVWGYARCSLPLFVIEDADSGFRLDMVDESVSHLKTAYIVQNKANSPHVFVQVGTSGHRYGKCDEDWDVEFDCPLGYRVPVAEDGATYSPKYCVPCPAGRVCGGPDGFTGPDSPTELCPAGRYCPAGTFDAELNRCDVFRYYTESDTGMTSREDCMTHGTACEFGFWCAPGTLEVDYVRILSANTPSSFQADEVLVYPSSRTFSFQLERTAAPIRPAAYPNDKTCYLRIEDVCEHSEWDCMNQVGYCGNYNEECNPKYAIAVHSDIDPPECRKSILLRANISTPDWLWVYTGVDDDPNSLYTPMQNLTVSAEMFSSVEGVSISATVAANMEYRFFSLWETYPYLADVMIPLSMSFKRSVTTVIFNPADQIQLKRALTSGNVTANATMFNIGCDDSVTWTARTWDCTHPSIGNTPLFEVDTSLYPIPWVSVVQAYSSGFIQTGSTDPATIVMVVSPKLTDPDRATKILGLRKYKACLRVDFVMTLDTSTVLKKDLDVVLDLYEDCPVGTYSDLGTSENGPCSPCETGSYTDTPGSTVCKACPEAFPRSRPGAVSIDECHAAPGYFRDVDGTSFQCSHLGPGVSCLDEGLTLETIPLLPGYWRSNNRSKVIVRCPNQAYCVGGVHDHHGAAIKTKPLGRNGRRLLSSSSKVKPQPQVFVRRDLAAGEDLIGSQSYCLEHHRGPYCQVCDPGYVKRGISPCSVCDAAAYQSDQQRLGWTIFAAFLIVLLAFLLTQRSRLKKFAKRRAGSIIGLANRAMHPHVAAVVERSSTDQDESDKRLSRARSYAPRELARTMSRRLKPISTKIDKRMNLLWGVMVSIEASTTLRILVSLFQVIGGISKNFGDIYPEVFTQIASAFNALSAEIFYNIDFACVITTNHYLSLILGMIAPVLATILILIVHLVFERRLKHMKRMEDIPRLRSGTYSVFLVLLFLIYPSVSSTILSSYVCKTFDDGSRWLRKDITINCDADDRTGWLVLASFGVVIYVIGIPACYTYSLVRVRREIDPVDPEQVPDKSKFASVLFLTEIYKRKYWYWEVIELVRKLLQSALIVFFLDGSVMQMIVMILVAMIFIQVINEFKPYVSLGANRLASIAQWEILLVSFIGLLLRVDLSTLDANFSYDKTEALTGCLITACFMAPAFAFYQKRKWLFDFFIVRRCGCRHGNSSNPGSNGAALEHTLSAWASVVSGDRTSKNGRDASSSQGDESGLESNPIALVERQTSLSSTHSPVLGTNHHHSHPASSNRVVSFAVDAPSPSSNPHENDAARLSYDGKHARDGSKASVIVEMPT